MWKAPTPRVPCGLVAESGDHWHQSTLICPSYQGWIQLAGTLRATNLALGWTRAMHNSLMSSTQTQTTMV